MVGLTPQQTEHLRVTLQDAVVKCSERCLYQSAKWAAELVTSLPHSSDLEASAEDSQMSDPDYLDHPAAPIVITPNTDPDEARLEAKEISKYLLAKSYFDCREYDRCAAVFLPDTVKPESTSSTAAQSRRPSSPPNAKGKGKASEKPSKKSPIFGPSADSLPRLSQKSLFLALYARFMAGEKRKDEDSEMILGPMDGGVTVNKEITRVGRDLDGWLGERTTADGDILGSQGWLEYLYGIVLAKGNNDDEALKWLIRSVTLYPWNWGAWQELSALLGSVENLRSIEQYLPKNLMTLMFHLFTSQELFQSNEEVHGRLADLQRLFPTSQFLKTQKALLLYHSKDYDEAETIFSDLLEADPHRLDSLDHYSNILYVMGSRPKLGFLAQVATITDKFRPETCCVVGNYYSLKSEHEKAVMYFRRALTLDRSFLSAWTLMGHEYVEMKNTHAAIESYRRAVDVNRKDYRAWYGLGQTYEVLEMHLYALFYYQRAAALHSYDPKLWQAVGACFSKMDRPLEAIKAFKRALLAGSYEDHANSASTASASFGSSASAAAGGAAAPQPGRVMDPEILYQIALMYEKLRDFDEASAYMELTLDQEEGPSSPDESGGAPQQQQQSQGVGVTATTSKARMWLAKWEFTHGDLPRAMELANELCQDGVEVEEAKALVRDLRARMEQAQTG